MSKKKQNISKKLLTNPKSIKGAVTDSQKMVALASNGKQEWWRSILVQM